MPLFAPASRSWGEAVEISVSNSILDAVAATVVLGATFATVGSPYGVQTLDSLIKLRTQSRTRPDSAQTNSWPRAGIVKSVVTPSGPHLPGSALYVRVHPESGWKQPGSCHSDRKRPTLLSRSRGKTKGKNQGDILFFQDKVECPLGFPTARATTPSPHRWPW